MQVLFDDRGARRSRHVARGARMLAGGEDETTSADAKSVVTAARWVGGPPEKVAELSGSNRARKRQRSAGEP